MLKVLLSIAFHSQVCLNYSSLRGSCTLSGVQGESQAADLGQLLMGFFRRFGSHFNLYTDAVAIGSGGICPKKDVCQFEEDVLAPKLCVQDISTLRYSLVLLLR